MNRRQISLVRQSEVAECGLACLAMVASYHGLHTDLASLRLRFKPSTRGLTLRSLIGMADQLGLNSRAIKVSLEQLDELDVPAILHWNLNHFVVLERVKRGRALIHNPLGRSSWIDLGELSKHFTGIAMELEPANDFQRTDQRLRLKLPQLWQKASGLKRALAQTLILSFLMQVFVLASPYYMQIALDSALPVLDEDLLAVLAVGFGLFTLINAGATLLRSFVLLSAGAALGSGITANVARRLLRLPISWFEKRHVGDVLSRFQSIAPIRQFLTEGAVGASLDGALALLTLAMMFLYSTALTAIAMTAFAIYGSVRLAYFGAQRDAQERAIATAGQEQSVMIESLRGIVTLRLFNKEAARHAFWRARLAESINSSVELGRLTAWQQAANSFIFGIETILSTWLAIKAVMAGGFSVGMVFAYLAYKTQFTQRGISFLDQMIAFRMLNLHLERLSDIAHSDQDVSFTGGPGAGLELRGRIELRDVSFRYSSTEPYVLQSLNLVVEPGEHIAITGPSGGGKSTLIKLLLGLLEPDGGEIDLPPPSGPC